MIYSVSTFSGIHRLGGPNGSSFLQYPSYRGKKHERMKDKVGGRRNSITEKRRVGRDRNTGGISSDILPGL